MGQLIPYLAIVTFLELMIVIEEVYFRKRLVNFNLCSQGIYLAIVLSN